MKVEIVVFQIFRYHSLVVGINEAINHLSIRLGPKLLNFEITFTLSPSKTKKHTEIKLP